MTEERKPLTYTHLVITTEFLVLREEQAEEIRALYEKLHSLVICGSSRITHGSTTTTTLF